MEADIADFKKKTIQANKMGPEEAERNTWNEQLALGIEQHEVSEAVQVNDISRDAVQAVDSMYGGALDVEALTGFTKVTENVYKEIATGRNVCARPRIRSNRQCDCWTLNNRYGLPQCDSLACVNVREYVVCPDDCYSHQLCRNQGFNNSTREAPVEPIASRFGVGLRAARGLSTGTFVMEYVGEVIDNIEYDTRLKTMIEEGATSFYFMRLSNKRFIDATKFGNLS
ncbi:histone methyltransferase set2 [Aphanomyces cochlioides]|nr:histone methyltransferase set2 [Aphanomyces cochlioides]